MARGGQTKQKARQIVGPDADEVEALDAAERMAKDYGIVGLDRKSVV